jgi:glucosylceramidase
MNSKRILLFFLILLLNILPLSHAQIPLQAQLWLTVVDRSALFTQQSQPLQFGEAQAQLPVVSVNDMQRFQPIEGFGFALTGGSAQLLMQMSAQRRRALLLQIFSTKGDGIGVSYLRVSIGSSDMNDHVYSYDDLPAGQTDPDMAHLSLAPDREYVIPALKEILKIDPQIRILGSPWLAPAWMKTNDAVKGGHLKPEYYGAYAQYFVKYIEAMKTAGIPLTAITVQNEPLNPKNTPSMAMFADEEDAFIGKYLGPAFAKAGIKTEIQIYDHNPDVTSYPLSILADPAASPYVVGTAFHLYGGTADALTKMHNAYPNKNLYMTEQSVTQRPHADTIDVAEPVSRVLIGATRNWSRNVLLWNLAADPHFGPHTSDGGCTSCSGAVTLDGDKASFNVAYYAMAHFSRFVRPGSVRIGSTELEQLSTVAFLAPDGRIVFVAANTGNFPKTFQIEYHGKYLATTVHSQSVGTYLW